tara:strand:+ start:5769 stop:7094 length:1326 start_codon:yes stop_codon:yes gene_type:complete
MVYPTLPLSAAAVAVFEEGMSPQYDITWSFTYELSGWTAGDEIGYCMFLQDGAHTLSGGGVGPDLGFSGGGPFVASTAQAMNKPIIGIGFDSLGIFAAPLEYTDATTRSGVYYVPNSVTIRDSDLNVVTTQALTGFDLVSDGKRTIRARLGDYGRKVFVDFKNEGDEFFTHILTQDVSIDIAPDSRFRPGVTLVKPLTGTHTNGVIVTTGFHVEGNQQDAVEETFEFTPLIPFSSNNKTLGPVPQKSPESESISRLPFLGMGPHIGCPDGTCDIPVTGATINKSFYPNTFIYGMSAFIGDVELQWKTTANPYRFIFNYDDGIKVDTGFVGNASYNYGGTSRDTFITGLLSSANHGEYPVTELAADGYPIVNSSLAASLSTFYKDTDTSRLKVNVFAPLSTTDWEVTVGCPYYTLSCGTEDSFLCGLTQQHETLRKIVFTNL